MKTDKELAKELKSLMGGDDEEYDHITADLFVTETLNRIGYPELAKMYKDLTEDFWYS